MAIDRLTILTNIPALQAANQLGRHMGTISQTMERLSTGQRINRASDDAAGLALSTVLDADRRIASVAIRNTNTAISLVDTAIGAVDEIKNLLLRMAELAQISINGINTVQSRSPLHAEFIAVASEISRISKATEFNGFKLVSPTNPATYPIVFQVGIDGSEYSQVAFSGVRATLAALQLGNEDEEQIYSINDATAALGQAAARTALEAVQEALDNIEIERGSLTAAGSQLSFAVSNLEEFRATLTESVGQIRGADIAQDTANLVAAQIRRDAAAAVLAQANQQPDIALKLLS